MSIFSDNLRYLRSKHHLSQQKIADNLIITRGRYAKYEDAASEPPVEIMLRISKFFHISIDLMLTVDLRKYPLEKIIKLPDNRIVLPITVDSTGENQIELVPHKASMGYLKGFDDPEYIGSLQNISLPFLRNGKYRAFPATGDSMPPFEDGTLIVGKYIEGADHLTEGRTYVFVTLNDGIVYKRFSEKFKNRLKVTSDNNFYEPLLLNLNEILEIWEFACSISMNEPRREKLEYTDIKAMFETLRREIKTLHK